MEPPFLTMWTVYDHPTDYPDCYVARQWIIPGGGEPSPTDQIITSPALDLVRAELQQKRRLRCIGRHVDDDPKIVETWI